MVSCGLSRLTCDSKAPLDFIILYTNVQHERMIVGILEPKKPLGLCRILDEEKNGYVARDQLLYAL